MLKKEPPAGVSPSAGETDQDVEHRDPNLPQTEIHEATDNTDALTQIATQIKALEKKNFRNVIEIGKLLHEASEQCEHREYLPWLKREFAWSYMTAKRYRDVFRLHDNYQIGDFDQFEISISALYLVAEHIDGEEAWKQTGGAAILEAAKSGRVTYKKALEIFQKHKDDGFELTPIETTKDATADDEAPKTFPKGRLAGTVKAMLAVNAHDLEWQAIMDFIGVEGLDRVITTLAAVRDKFSGSIQTSAVKAAADRAERKVARSLYVV